jgi:hypothetical protein
MGDSFPLLPISSAETVQLCKGLPISSDQPTLFIASYPKSGTTWMQAIVYALLSHGKTGLELVHISDWSPFYEVDKTWEVGGVLREDVSRNHTKLGVRVFNTHLRRDMLPAYAKSIYVVRTAKDVLGSFYHHLSNQDEESGGTGAAFPTFDEFTMQWQSGALPYGKWTDHVYNWTRNTKTESESETGDDSLLLIRYEDLLGDLCGNLEKIALFLSLSIEKEEFGELATKLSFQGMKGEKEKYEPVSVKWKNGFNFLRKGVQGDSSSLFDEPLLARYNEAMLDDILSLQKVAAEEDHKALSLIKSLAEVAE